MKIHFDLPWGGTFEMERRPMSKERANLLAGVIFALISAVVFIKFFAMIV